MPLYTTDKTSRYPSKGSILSTLSTTGADFSFSPPYLQRYASSKYSVLRPLRPPYASIRSAICILLYQRPRHSGHLQCPANRFDQPRRSSQVLTTDIRDLAVLPEDIVVPAAILKWMAGFEEWLRKSFLHVLFSDPYDPTDTEHWINATSDPDRSDLIWQFVELWDQVFSTMREFLIDIHYTNTIDLTGDTLRPYTDYEVYIKQTQLLIAAANNDYCTAMTPLDENKLAWWDHRRMLLQKGATRREGVAWLLQVREQMDELASRYPDAEASLRRPFMMPAIHSVRKNDEAHLWTYRPLVITI
ncbi:hypothetical protein KCU71_g52, partial [Aureobasidium melanogenum]